MYFKLSNTKDIKSVIKRRYVDDILEKENNLVGTDKNGNKKDHIHVVQFKLKKSKEQDIYIFTDGSRLQEKDKEWHKNKKSNEVYQKEVVKDEVHGYGVYIESKDKEVYTYGVISNLSNKHSQENDYTKMIELKAIEEAFVNLQQQFKNLGQRNVYLYSDNLYNLKDLNALIKLELLSNNDPEYKQAEKLVFQLRKNKKKFAILEKLKDFIIENKINISWIRSHQGYKQNEIVDQLAKHAVSVEKNDYLTNTSRIPNVYALHSFTEIIDKTEKALQQDQLQQVNLSQKYSSGDGEVVIKNNHIHFKHHNFTSIQTKINHNCTLLVRSEFDHDYLGDKNFYQNIKIHELEKQFKDENDVILARINGANVNSMLGLINEYCEKHKYNIQKLNLRINSNYDSTLVSDYFFKTIDNNFNHLIPHLKHIEDIKCEYTQPLGNQAGIKRVYNIVENYTVYKLYGHKNDQIISGLLKTMDFVDENKLKNIRQTGLNEISEINENSTFLLQKIKMKEARKQGLENDEIYKEISLSKEIDKGAKLSINPLADMKSFKRK